MFIGRILLTSQGHTDTRGWSDLVELANTKAGWEALGSFSSSLLSGDKWDHMGNAYPIPQTVAGQRILTWSLMIIRVGTHRSLNLHRLQFFKPNTRSVRYSQNILRNRTWPNVAFLHEDTLRYPKDILLISIKDIHTAWDYQISWDISGYLRISMDISLGQTPWCV